MGNFRIDFYSGSINGDAEIFLGSLTDSIVSSLDLEFAVFFNVSVPVGKILHAVVTNLDTGDSSELSNGIVVV